MNDTCPRSTRVDGPYHSWHFDGDDPRIICAFCGEVRDAHSGYVFKPGASAPAETCKEEA